MKHTVVLIGAVLLALVSFASSQVSQPLGGTHGDTIRAHMTFLADDLLEGRGTGTRGFELAAKYAATQFASMGLQPGGSDGGYFQRVRFRSAKPIADRSALVVDLGDQSQPFEWGRDFVVGGNVAQSPLTVTAPIVFVGYGISAPELGHDDYAGDVRGAIVAFLPGAPPNVPTDRREYYDSVKWTLAQERGAVATIELSTPEQEKTWTWKDRMYWVDIASTWLETDGSLPTDGRVPRILFSTAGTARLLGSRTIAGLVASRQPVHLAKGILTVATEHEEMTAPHVLAILQGSDPQLRGEYVVYTAHLDGSGRGEPVDGDDIYNSAIDNALGSAMLLTLAKTFGNLVERPKRSLLFFATTGEELGIQGSPYFVEHPTVPLDKMVAVLNIDGPSLLTDPLRSVLVMGASNSSLGVVTEQSARQLGLTVKAATAPLNYSDHFPFVMKGVPALWMVSADERSAAEKMALGRIHKPSDDMNRTFHWDAAEKFTQLYFIVGHTIANQVERPRWNPADILGEKFGTPIVSVPQ